jgi:hypothetical protein
VSALSALHEQASKCSLPVVWEWRNANCTGNDEAIAGWPMLAIRLEQVVLMVNPVSGQQALYDTIADEGQTRDLAKDKPDLVRTLAGQMEDYGRSLPGYDTRPGSYR